MSFGELLQRFVSGSVSQQLLDEICATEKLTVTELFFKCSSLISHSHSTELSQSALQIIAFIVSNNLIQSVESVEVEQLLADTIISLPAKISNTFELDPQLKRLLFLQLISPKSFSTRQIKASLKRLFVLGEYQFLLAISHLDIWNVFINSLSLIEIVHFGKQLVLRGISFDQFFSAFNSSLTVEILVHLIEVPIDPQYYHLIAHFNQTELFRQLIQKFWDKKSFISCLPMEIHNQICMLIKLAWSPVESLTPLIMKGIHSHLDSKIQEYRIIGMIFAEKLTNGETSFDLDLSNPLVTKWASDLSVGGLIEEKKIRPDAVDITEIERNLKSIKMRTPIFIGEIIDLLKRKEMTRSIQEIILNYTPSILMKGERGEIGENFHFLIQHFVHLRDEFEIIGFSEAKSAIISSLFKLEPAKSVRYISQQIFLNSLSEGDKMFLLDLLNKLVFTASNDNKVENCPTDCSLSQMKNIRFISQTSLKIRKSPNVQAIDSFKSVFIPNLFFSLLYQLPSNNKHPTAISESLLENLLLLLSNCLIHSKVFHESTKMNDEFGSYVIQHLTLNSTCNENTKTILCSYFAFVSSFNSQTNSLELVLRITNELDSLLSNCQLDSGTRSFAITIMQLISQLAPP